MLHRIVEHHDIEPLYLPFELLDAPHAALTDSHRYFRKSTVDLHSLIADSGSRSLCVRQYKTTGCPLVTAREHRRVIAVRYQQTHEVLHHRRFAGAAHRQVTHTDSRHIDGERQQQMPVKQHMADRHARSVEPTQRDGDDGFEHRI